MCKLTHWCLMTATLLIAYQSASAGDYRYTSRAELYKAQAQQYVADRTRSVAPRIQYVQPRAAYMANGHQTAPIRQQVPYRNLTRAQVVRNASYHSPATVTVIEDVVPAGQDLVLDDVVVEERPVEVHTVYVQPAPYVGYNGYNNNRPVVYQTYPAYYGPSAYRPYGHYPAYRNYPVYRVGAYYNRGYGHRGYGRGYRRGGGYGYGGYGHRGYRRSYGYGGYGYGGYGRCGGGSSWGIAIGVRF